jgi:hypothetical protein
VAAAREKEKIGKIGVRGVAAAAAAQQRKARENSAAAAAQQLAAWRVASARENVGGGVARLVLAKTGVGVAAHSKAAKPAALGWLRKMAAAAARIGNRRRQSEMVIGLLRGGVADYGAATA